MRPVPAPDRVPGGLAPYGGGAVRFGTSSFSCKDWVGPFYPPGTPPGAFLERYAEAFDTVEVDATYYGLPSARLVDGWDAKTPAGFLLAAKFPKTIVHGGTGARPDPRHALAPDATYDDRDEFLGAMRRLGTKRGPLVLQFPYFSREAFPSAGPFLERLDRFLGDLPPEAGPYAVEVRNKAWLRPPLRDVLLRHGAGLVLTDQEWMPHGTDVVGRLGVVAGTGPVYVRLLGERGRIEAETPTFDREVIDRTASLERWAELIAELVRGGSRVLVYANNHYAGHGPATARRLRAAVATRLCA